MTAFGWCAVAVAVLMLPAAASSRTASLVGSRRLAATPVLSRPPSGSWARARLGPRAVAMACGVGCAAPCAVVLWRGGVALAAATGAIVGTAAVVVLDASRTRTAEARRVQLVAAVRVLVAELECGSRADSALTAAAAIGPSYRTVFEAAAALAESGADAAQPLLADEDTRSVGVAWRLGQVTGAATAGVLAQVVADLAARGEQRRSVTVALSGPRSSAAVLTGLPLIGIAMGAAMGADPLAFLLTTHAGSVVCLAGVLLDVAGVFWVRRIVSSAARS